MKVYKAQGKEIIPFSSLTKGQVFKNQGSGDIHLKVYGNLGGTNAVCLETGDVFSYSGNTFVSPVEGYFQEGVK